MPLIITKTKEEKNTGPMDPLPETKVKNGYLYKLVKRTDSVAMYSQQYDKPEDWMPKNVIGYEVLKVLVTKPCSIMQKNGAKKGMWYQYPATEKFPGNEDFGKTAWAYTSIEYANKKYEELSK